MSLREPLKQSLELLDNLLSNSDLIGSTEIKKKESFIKAKYPLFEEFERTFPSILSILANVYSYSGVKCTIQKGINL